MRRWASIAASTSAYRHARLAFRGKVLEDRELGHQDRPNRRRSRTSRDRDLEIASEAICKQLIPKLCLCQCVPKLITLLLSHTEIRLPCGPSGISLWVLLYKEGPCVRIETTGLTDQPHPAEELHLNQTTSVARLKFDSGFGKHGLVHEDEADACLSLRSTFGMLFDAVFSPLKLRH